MNSIVYKKITGLQRTFHIFHQNPNYYEILQLPVQVMVLLMLLVRWKSCSDVDYFDKII